LKSWREEFFLGIVVGCQVVICMSTKIWIVGALLLLGVVLLASYLREQFKKSRQAEKNIDYSKIKRWDDDEEDDWP
jgi:hypothetical protein